MLEFYKGSKIVAKMDEHDITINQERNVSKGPKTSNIKTTIFINDPHNIIGVLNHNDEYDMLLNIEGERMWYKNLKTLRQAVLDDPPTCILKDY
jgi:hypothetical protein